MNKIPKIARPRSSKGKGGRIWLRHRCGREQNTSERVVWRSWIYDTTYRIPYDNDDDDDDDDKNKSVWDKEGGMVARVIRVARVTKVARVTWAARVVKVNRVVMVARATVARKLRMMKVARVTYSCRWQSWQGW